MKITTQYFQYQGKRRSNQGKSRKNETAGIELMEREPWDDEAASERFADDDFALSNEELRRALFRSANDRHEAVDLTPRDQAQHAAGRARKHSPIRVFLLADFAGVLEDKNCSGLHLFGNPFVQNVKFSDHAFLLFSASSTQCFDTHLLPKKLF